jgi:serine/threonine protein kinase
MTRWERRTSDPLTEAVEARCYGCFVVKPAQGPCSECGYDEHQPRPPLALPHGVLVNRHYVIGRLVGGHAITGFTYLALDTRLDHVVMMREYLPRNLAGRNLRTGEVFPHNEKSAVYAYGEQEFINEAQRLFKLNHPNLAKVRDLIRCNGTQYVVMDYHVGSTVQQLMQQVNGILQPKEAMEIIMPLLDGLEAAHAQGCLHLDLHPNNVMLVGRRAPLLMGFAGAKHALAQRTLSLFTAVSAGYASPEQYYNHREVTQAADVYGVSALLYTLLTGAIPPEAIERAETDTLVAPSRLHPRVPKFINYAVMRGLAVNVADRPQSMSDLRELLRETEERMVDIGSLGAARPASATPPPASKGWRSIAVGAILFAGACVALWKGVQLDRSSSASVEPSSAQTDQHVVPMSGMRSLDYGDAPAPRSVEPVSQVEIAEISDARVAELTPGAAALLRNWPTLSVELGSAPINTDVTMVNEDAALTALLAKATRQLQAQQLDQPAGNNALESYRAVLAQDPTNALAMAGQEAVLGILLNRVEAAILTRDWPSADAAMSRLQGAAPDDARVLALSGRLNEAKTAQPQVTEVSTSPEQLARWLAQVDVYVKQDRFAGVGKSNALNKLNAILAVQPNYPEAQKWQAELLPLWREALNESIEAKNPRRVDVLLEQAAPLGVAGDELARWRVLRDAFEVAPPKPVAVVATTVPSISELSRQRRRQAVVQQLGARAAALKSPIVNIYYENTHRRTSAFAIASDGRFISPMPLRDRAFAFVWPAQAQSVAVFFETKRGLQFEFDAPVVIDERDVAGGDVISSGVVWRDVYVNDAHDVASFDNFQQDAGALPPVLTLPSSLRAPLGSGPLYVRSSLNEWRAEVSMDFVGSATYAATMPMAESFSEFKFADADWSPASNFGGGFGAKGLVRGGGAKNLALDISVSGPGQYQYALFTRQWPGHGRIVFHRVERIGELPADYLVAQAKEADAEALSEASEPEAVTPAGPCRVYRAGPRQGIVVRKECAGDERAAVGE